MSGERGYTPYNPRGDTRYWLQCAQKVVHDYQAHWPLTVRQIFYRMVAMYDFPKKESDYGKLVNIVSKARRCSMLGSPHGIPFAAIRDDRGTAQDAFYYDSPGHFLDALVSYAQNYRIDRWQDQPVHLELWCEAAGMVPILSRVARPYGLRVSSGGGYDSVTAKHKLAKRVQERFQEDGIKTLVLHVGDFDPSGEDLSMVLGEDVLMMVSQLLWDDGRVRRDAFELERVALTGEQVVEREIETAPPKPTDSRMQGFVNRHPDIVDQLGTTDIAAQLEALEPQALTDLFENMIEQYIDHDAYDQVLDRERTQRDELVAQLTEWRETQP
jgi:hypothetical protein